MLAPSANANVSPRPGDRFVWAKHLVTMVQTGTDSAQPGTLCVGLISEVSPLLDEFLDHTIRPDQGDKADQHLIHHTVFGFCDEGSLPIFPG